MSDLIDFLATEDGGRARYYDVRFSGFIERRPTPARPVGMPVGHDGRGQPIYHPQWADYTWFATWVDAEAFVIKADRRRLIRTHRRMVDHSLQADSIGQASPGQLTDWRDSLATVRDLWDALHAREAAISA